MQNFDEFGRPVPKIQTDHVHVYSQSLQMSLGPSDEPKTRKGFGSTSASALYDVPLSPGPPLRGYAATSLQKSSPPAAVGGRASPGGSKDQREADYQAMMQSILDRTREQNQQQEQDENRQLERLLQHIEKEQEFVDQLDEQLELQEQAKFRRQQELYKEWKEKVFAKIQGQIDSQLAQLRTEDISERRRALMEDYIRISNQKKFGLYRDIIIESEYDPQTAHKTLMKYTMRDEMDPLKQEIVAAELGKPKRKELGRATLSATMWDRLHSTPYGRFDRVITPDISNLDPSAVSRVPFEHYKIATDKQTLNREFPRGKRIECGGRDMRRSHIFDPMEVRFAVPPTVPEV